MQSKYIYLIDCGHGGLIDGKYQTAGKRSPKFEDRTFEDGTPFVFYEGVNNRMNGKLLMDEMMRRNISYFDIVASNKDVPLTNRVKYANELAKHEDRKCIYISIHSNAHGNGSEWTTAKGNSVHIYPRASTKSREFADLLADEFKNNYKDFTRWRGIKENNFYVLRWTDMPAVLLETGFMTNKAECKLMLTTDWKERFVKSVITAIERFEMK